MQKQKQEKIGRWKKTEHEKFMKALEKYGKNWPLVQKAVKTRSLTQVRSHAQKLFLSMSSKDIKQLEAYLDERFDLFCKKSEEENGIIEEVKIEDPHENNLEKGEEPSSTLHRDQLDNKNSLKDVLVLKVPPPNSVSHDSSIIAKDRPALKS